MPTAKRSALLQALCPRGAEGFEPHQEVITGAADDPPGAGQVSGGPVIRARASLAERFSAMAISMMGAADGCSWALSVS